MLPVPLIKFFFKKLAPRYIDEVLPTRVIGVGVSEGSVTSLISSTKVRGTFSTLSHVWGEKILTT